MKVETLNEVAIGAGIRLERPDATGAFTSVSPLTKRALLDALGSGPKAPETPMTGSCYMPDYLHEAPCWGITLQLYELRSSRNWGIGDFADLKTFCIMAGRAGADFVGLNPLHALFSAEPERCSPFAPSNRLFLNPLYIAPDLLEPDIAFGDDKSELASLRSAGMVDYAAVGTNKMKALLAIFLRRRATDATELEAFAAEGGLDLRRHAIFEALSSEMKGHGFGAGWKSWPLAYQDPAADDVAAFESGADAEIAFHIWLQWIARRQLAEAAEAGREAGLRIGLYLDLAVGEAPDGSATWSNRSDYLKSVTIGAPPDVFSTEGQSWGLAALSPRRLEASDDNAFSRLFDAAIKVSGAIRIDHAMALKQLFLIPEGFEASDGAYVEYPIGRLINRLAADSQAQRTIVIGEDLGVVPDGFREMMEKASILSYRILYFEQDTEGFIAPQDYPPLSLACTSTHDLPTLGGWWSGRDIDLRETFGLVDEVSSNDHRSARQSERARLADAIGIESEPSLHHLVVAAYRFMAQTASKLVAVRLADLAEETEPTNLPGTSKSYPNWQRKLTPRLEELEHLALWQIVTAVMRSERPRQ
jgi:4-alpha-glucanotransferase